MGFDKIKAFFGSLVEEVMVTSIGRYTKTKARLLLGKLG